MIEQMFYSGNAVSLLGPIARTDQLRLHRPLGRLQRAQRSAGAIEGGLERGRSAHKGQV